MGSLKERWCWDCTREEETVLKSTAPYFISQAAKHVARSNWPVVLRSPNHTFSFSTIKTSNTRWQERRAWDTQMKGKKLQHRKNISAVGQRTHFLIEYSWVDLKEQSEDVANIYCTLIVHQTLFIPNTDIINSFIPPISTMRWELFPRYHRGF